VSTPLPARRARPAPPSSTATAISCKAHDQGAQQGYLSLGGKPSFDRVLGGETIPRSAGHGKAADWEQVLMEDYHGSGRKVFGYLVEVGKDDL
jgi:hypothetical protein